MTNVTTRPAEILLRVEGGVLNRLAGFDLPVEDEDTVYGSSIAYGVAVALQEQLAHVDDPAWKRQIRDWLFPSEGVSAGASHDSVNHPRHYTSYKGLEVIDLTEQMNFNRGNAVKYLARAGLKEPEKEVEDLSKALWYTKREISRLTGD